MENLKIKKIQPGHLQKIFGGGEWIQTSSQSNKNIGGQNVTVTTTDSYHDANGDKQWGPGESGSMCQTISQSIN